MGYRIMSDKMVREHWIPLLMEMAREDWLKIPIRQPPLWPHLDSFLEVQPQACREKERLGLTSTDYTGTGENSLFCTECKSKIHNIGDCKAQFCLTCKSWKCKNRSHRKQRSERDDQEPSHCHLCDDDHPYGSHTKSRVETRKRELSNPSETFNFSNTNQKYYMQAASTCRRCKAEIQGSQQTCGACGQTKGGRQDPLL